MEIQHLNCFEGENGTYENIKTGQKFTLSNRQFLMGNFKKRPTSKKVHTGSYYAYDITIDGNIVETQVMLPNFKDEVRKING